MAFIILAQQSLFSNEYILLPFALFYIHDIKLSFTDALNYNIFLFMIRIVNRSVFV